MIPKGAAGAIFLKSHTEICEDTQYYCIWRHLPSGPQGRGACTGDSQLHTLKQQPPLAPAVVVCSQLACDTSIQLLELRLALLVEDDVRRIWLLPRGADANVLHLAHVLARRLFGCARAAAGGEAKKCDSLRR